MILWFYVHHVYHFCTSTLLRVNTKLSPPVSPIWWLSLFSVRLWFFHISDKAPAISWIQTKYLQSSTPLWLPCSTCRSAAWGTRKNKEPWGDWFVKRSYFTDSFITAFQKSFFRDGKCGPSIPLAPNADSFAHAVSWCWLLWMTWQAIYGIYSHIQVSIFVRLHWSFMKVVFWHLRAKYSFVNK